MKSKLFPNLKRLTSVFSIAILLITVTMLLLRLTVFNTDQPTKAKINSVQTPQDENTQTTEDKAVEFSYNISDKIVFKDFNATANPQIENHTSNKYLMQVKIIREDTKTLIYSSDYIKPGFNTRTMKLQGQPMEAGTYACNAEVIVSDAESLDVIEILNKPITVEIQNSLEE